MPEHEKMNGHEYVRGWMSTFVSQPNRFWVTRWYSDNERQIALFGKYSQIEWLESPVDGKYQAFVTNVRTQISHQGDLSVAIAELAELLAEIEKTNTAVWIHGGDDCISPAIYDALSGLGDYSYDPRVDSMVKYVKG